LELGLCRKLDDRHMLNAMQQTPMRGRDGSIAGIFNSTFETSSKVVAERRLTTLHVLGSRAGRCHSPLLSRVN
jgi:hypothetical protein